MIAGLALVTMREHRRVDTAGLARAGVALSSGRFLGGHSRELADHSRQACGVCRKSLSGAFRYREQSRHGDDGLAPATARYAHRVLSLALTAAVRDGRLVRNVAEGVPLPRIVGNPKRFLTHDQVQALAEACAPYGR
jgi:integrase